ncbi:Beta-1,3-galactosyl-O-glycosyl-glycoprotein beta-1,6-N-acetylglucosaminyltransferase [Bulinus truncatus]|nr:Beta-1,3-galactosyl-O-glycosyl-glycoprotein beta-1,6-N-acetylglucosaminyltransferase [Bulinus truncatus]
MRCKWRKILVRPSLPKLILIVPCLMTVFYVLSNTLNVVPIVSRMNKGTSLVKFNGEMIGNSTEIVRTGRDTNIKLAISASVNQLIRKSDQLIDLYRSTSGLKQTTSSRRQSNFTCLGRQLDEIEDIYHVLNVNCRKMFSGDHDEIVFAQNYLKTMNITMLSDQFYLNLTTNCELFQKQRGYIMCPLTSEEEDFPIAFTMLAYKDVEMVERLLRSIYRPQNYYCIHVDKKSDDQFMKEFPLKTNWELDQILKAYNGANDVEGTIRRANKNRWLSTPPQSHSSERGGSRGNKSVSIPETDPDSSMVKPFLARFKNCGNSPFAYPCAVDLLDRFRSHVEVSLRGLKSKSHRVVSLCGLTSKVSLCGITQRSYDVVSLCFLTSRSYISVSVCDLTARSYPVDIGCVQVYHIHRFIYIRTIATVYGLRELTDIRL